MRVRQRFFESRVFQSNKTRILRLYVGIRRLLASIFSLQEGTDAIGTITDIRSNVQLRGANVWILICAAGLASIGLDVNSVAVIIGAMLISPLMSPILGIGLGVGINDRDLLIDSLKNFGTAVAVSIGASTLYFLITPLGQPTAELAARTEPTLLDVGVALFGGVAGIIAGSRREKTNAIPGVAIATALMPPLCTAGFGLATGHWAYFFGAFYLFFINAVFISFSTFLIVRFLHFPYHDFPDEQTKRMARRWIVGFVVIVMAPSAFIFYNVIRDLRDQTAIKSFLKDYMTTESYEPIQSEQQEEGDSIKYLKVYMVGEPIGRPMIDSFAQAMENYGLDDYRLKVIQMNIPEEERERLTQEATKNVLKTIELSQTAQEKQETDGTVDSLKRVIAQMRGDTIPLWSISAELAALLPEVRNLGYAGKVQTAGDSAMRYPVFLYDFTRDYGRARQEMVRRRLEEYLQQRAGKDSILLRRLVE